MQAVDLYQSVFPSCVWRLPHIEEKRFFLTFDDGPIPEVTPWVLDVLKSYNVKAHFFCVGDNVRKYPAIYKRILEEGHKVGNHTHNHVNGWTLHSNIYLKNVSLAKQFIDSKLFRPPYGKLLRPQIKWLQAKGYTIVMWDILTKDYDSKISPESCLQRSLKAKEGSIILFHDSIKAEVNLRYALPKFIETKLSEGYEFDLMEG